MTLEELGAGLREAREERGATLDAIAAELRIPRRILAEIEEGGASVPRSVFTLNFIRQYARYLGRTAEETAELTASLEGFEEAVRPSLLRSTVGTPVRQSAVPAVLASVFKTALILAAAGAAYMAYLNFFAGREAQLPFAGPSVQAPAPAPSATPPAAPAEKAGARASAPAPAPEAAPAAAPSPVPADPVVTAEALRREAEAPAGTPADPQKPAVPGEVQQPQPGPAAPEAPAPETPPLPEGMHQVEVISDSGDCWMGFEPDGKKQQRTLRKGDTFSMTFRDSLVIRLGNSQAVRILYDGKELDRTSSPRVVTLTFPPRR